MEREHLLGVNAARRARKAVLLVRDVALGATTLLQPGQEIDEAPLRQAVERAFRTGKSGFVHLEEGDPGYFLNVFLPPPRLIIIGAVHISQVLAPMASMAGFDVTVIDPRTAFASPERFDGVHLLPEWPQDALRTIRLDAFTALAAVTHDPKIDDFALIAALQAGCFYVGALGSRKTHAKRLERLREVGVSEIAASTIKAPIGLAIEAQSPAEIAVSILAEIIAELRQRAVPQPPLPSIEGGP